MHDSEKSKEQLIKELNKLRSINKELQDKNKNQISDTEDSLLADHDFSSKIMESLPGIFYIYTYPELRMVLWNKNHEHLLGFEHDEMVNRYIMDWHVPGADSAVKQAVDYVMKHGQNTLEASLVHKNGETIPFLLTGIRFETANQQYLLGFGIKITEQKKLEQELKESEALFRLLAENSTDMIARHDKNGDFIYASPSCRTILGFKPEELYGHSAFEFIHPDDIKIVEDSLKSISKEAYISTTTFRIRTKDGSYKWFETKSKAIFDDETNEVEEIHASSRDVTGRVLAEQKLKENEQNLNALFTSMTEMVVLHDVVFDENQNPINYRIIDCNDAFTKITGITKEQAIGKLSTEVYQTEDAPYLKEFSGVAISGETYEYESYFAPMDKYFMISVVSPAKNKFATITTDITQIKQIQKSIKTNEEKQRSMIANISDVIAIVDRNGNNAYKSPNIERIFGWKPEELVGESTFKLVHPDDLLIAQNFFNDVLASSESSSINFEFRYKCKDNSFKWVALTATNQLNNPIINGILLNYHDINPKKEAEAELILAKEKAEESERKLLEAQELSHVGNWEYIIDNDIIIWSKELFNIFERSYDLPAPKYSEQAPFYTEESFTKLDKAVQDCIKHETPYELELSIITSSGTVKQIISKGTVIKDKNNKITGCYGTAQDITQKKKIEQELITAKVRAEESEQRLKLATSSAQLGIWDWNVKENKMDWDERMFQLYGIKKEAFVNTLDAWSNGLHPEDKERAISESNEALKGNKQFDTAFRVLHPDGKVLYIKADGLVLRDSNGDAKRMIGINRDITESKLNEIELIKAKEKAEEANKLKTEFLNNMSHEIRTPMNGILGFSEMLVNPNISSEKRKYYSNIVQNSSHQLLRIIDDILEISTLETKQEQINETEFCLNNLIMEVFSIFNLKSKERHIPIYVKKELLDAQSNIITDRSKLNKILSNLLENALKYTSEGMIEIGYFIENDLLKLYVKDTGIGISPKNHQLIFERFSQEDKEISLKHGGLGLGLSISKENAQLLGGDITLTSEKDQGSTFYVTIPYKPTQTENEKTAEIFTTPQKTESKYTILIVEDEVVNYLYLEALLGNEIKGDYNLIHAINGKEAVDICAQNNTIKLVLMDIKMPVMNGYEATEIIKSKYPDLPIIAQTAYCKDSDRELALKHGCVDFITKPINKEKLLGMINKYWPNS